MLYPDRATVCVSSQAGCAMGCGFCATGQAGFTRQLTTGEIVEQVVRAVPPGPRRRPPGQQRRVHGHGRAAGQRAGGVGRRRAAARRPRPVGPPPHDLDRRHRARHPPPRRAPPAGRRWPSACTPPTTSCATSWCRSTGATRSRTLMAACADYLDDQRPPAELRVGADRRRQRPAVRRRRARRAVPPAPARRPRQPDPAQPDARAGRRRARRRRGVRGVPRPAAVARASTPPCAATGAPTSTPRAVSWRRPRR